MHLPNTAATVRSVSKAAGFARPGAVGARGRDRRSAGERAVHVFG